jgi:hypothetical protein
MDARDEAQELREERCRELKKESWVGSVVGQML